MPNSVVSAPAIPVRPADDADLDCWFEDLCAGRCSEDEFLQEVLRLETESPEVTWEVLALLDQLFRRKRLSREIFISLKSRLHQHALGVDKGRAGAEWADTPITAAAAAPSVLPAISSVAPPLQPEVALAPRQPAAAETPFHRSIVVGDVLCERYQVLAILRRKPLETLVEAIDERKSGLPGIRPRLAIQVLDEAGSRDPQLLLRIGKLQGLSHPAIVRMLDIDETHGALLISMEMLGGVSLQDLLDRNLTQQLATPFALMVVRAVAGALAYAHSRGVSHGDVSAANIVVSDYGDIHLQGFALRRGGYDIQPAADRVAFAWLAYNLLSGTAHPDGRARDAQLAAPPGITRVQWRILRDALTGKEDQHAGKVLSVFAGEAPAAADRLTPVHAFAPPGRSGGRGAGDWLAISAVAVVLAVGGYLYLNATSDESLVPAAVAATSGAPAAAPAPRAVPPAPVVPPAAQRVEPAAAAAQPAPPAPPIARPLIDLATTSTWVDTSATFARVWVRRRGSLEGNVTFQWWTEDGSARVGRDFHRQLQRVEVIPSGARGVEIMVPLVPDTTRREPRTFFIKIDRAGGAGASLGSRTLMQVAIVPPGYPANGLAQTAGATTLSE